MALTLLEKPKDRAVPAALPGPFAFASVEFMTKCGQTAAVRDQPRAAV